VRESLHAALNKILNAKEDEVARYADLPSSELANDQLELKRAWEAARHAVSDPLGLTR
jgi:hypothetical protein